MVDNNPWGDNKPKSTGRYNKGIDDFLREWNMKMPSFKGGGFNSKRIIYSLMALMVLWALSGFYIVQPDESGVELLFGKYKQITTSGLNYNPPAPIGRVLKVKTATVHKEEIGFRLDGSRITSNPGMMLTGDENIVNISFAVQWRIRDPYKYLFSVRDDFSSKTIKSASESAMRDIIGQNSINLIMVGEGRAKVALETHELLQKIIDVYDMGIEILSVQLIKVDPPENVIDSFRDVQSAKADKEREVNQAQAFYNDIIPKSRGGANKIIQEAETYRQQVINSAEGETSRFVAIYNEYKNNKDLTKTRLYLESMEDILKDLEKVIINSDSNTVSYLPLQDLLRKKTDER